MADRVVNVNTAAGLIAAVKAAKGLVVNTTINLAPGEYGDVYLKNMTGSALVTIKSANSSDDASFDTLRMDNVHNLIFRDIDVNHPLEPGESVGGQAMHVRSSSEVTFVNLDLRGSMNGSSFDDAHGLQIMASNRIAVLDSTFEQLNGAINISRSDAVVLAGNSFTGARQAVSIAETDNALFEKNYFHDMQPNYGEFDHPDYFQVMTGPTYLGSNHLTFRSNVMIEGTSDFIGGIYVQSERRDEGIRHTDITVENNFYWGNYRHALSFTGVDDVIVRNNSIVNGPGTDPTAAISLKNVRGAAIDGNVTPMLIENRIEGNTGVSVSRHIDTYDVETRLGIAPELVIAPLRDGPINFNQLGVRPGTEADRIDAGFAPVPEIGNLTTSATASYMKYKGVVDDLWNDGQGGGGTAPPKSDFGLDLFDGGGQGGFSLSHMLPDPAGTVHLV